MVERTITKNLAGIEDLSLGKGIDVQERANATHSITKIDLYAQVNTLAELKTLDITSYLKAYMLGTTTFDDSLGGIFHWDAVATDTADDIDIIKANGVPIGRWFRVGFGRFKVSVILEAITDAGVTIEGVLIKDGAIVPQIGDGSDDFILMQSDSTANVGQTYSSQTCNYTKASSLVNVDGILTMTSLGSLVAGTQAQIGGLPSIITQTGGIWTFPEFSNTNLPAGTTITGRADNSNTWLNLFKNTPAGSTAPLLISDLNANSSIRIAGLYIGSL